MIASLRRRHRKTWLLLVFLLTAIFFAAWKTHRPLSTMERLPDALTQGDVR